MEGISPVKPFGDSLEDRRTSLSVNNTSMPVLTLQLGRGTSRVARRNGLP